MKSPFGIEILRSILATSFNSSIINLVADPSLYPSDIFLNDMVESVSFTDETGIEFCTRAEPSNSVRGIVVGIQPIHSNDNELYRKGDERRIIRVCEDPFLICKAMVNKELHVDEMGLTFNIDTATGNKFTGTSLVQLDYDSISLEDGQFRVSKILEIFNDGTTEYTIVECSIIKHELLESRVNVHTYWNRSGGNLVPKNAGDNINLSDAGLGKGFLDPIDDTDVVNKRYLVDYIDNHPSSGIWARVGTDMIPQNAGDSIDLQHGGKGKGFLDPTDDYDVVNRRFLVAYINSFPIISSAPKVDVFAPIDDQTLFTLSETPFSEDGIVFNINGINYFRNNGGTNGFSLSGDEVTWAEPYGIKIKSTDKVIAWYNFSAAFPGPTPPPSDFTKRTIVDVTAPTFAHTFPTDTTKIFTNRGNPGDATFTLPIPTISEEGEWIEYYVAANFNMQIEVSGSPTNKIVYNDAEYDYLKSEEQGSHLYLIVMKDLKWHVMEMDNNWNAPLP